MSENFEFWKMVLYSPAIVALAGGVAASFFHLITTLINKHKHQIKLQEWSRSEESRKESVMFEKKCQVYEEYANCFDPENVNSKTIDAKIRFILIKLVLYGFNDVKNAAREHFYALVEAYKNSTNEDYSAKQIELTGNILHQRMMEDIQNYTSRNLSK